MRELIADTAESDDTDAGAGWSPGDVEERRHGTECLPGKHRLMHTAEERASEDTSGFTRFARRLLPPKLLRAATDPGRAACLGVGLLAVLVAAALFALGNWGGSSGSATTSAAPPALPSVRPVVSTTATSEPLVVSVVGKVQQPGLTTVEPGARVADALEAAGGPKAGTDILGLNLARKMEDGEQLYVGIEPPSVARQPSRGGPEPKGESRLDINSAEADELEELPGVGPVTAKRIVTWRDEHGSFDSVQQLREIDGIGTVKLSRLRELVRV